MANIYFDPALHGGKTVDDVLEAGLNLFPEPNPRFDLTGVSNMLRLVQVVCAKQYMQDARFPTVYTAESLGRIRDAMLSVAFLKDVWASHPHLIHGDPGAYRYYHIVDVLLPKMQLFLDAYLLMREGESVGHLFVGWAKQDYLEWFCWARDMLRDTDSLIVSQLINHA